MTKIFVGNLSFDTRDSDLNAAFAQYGSVTEATVVLDRDSQRSRGFGFVEMPNSTEANSAIQALNGQDLQGRPLTVNEARPRTERSGGGGGGRGGYGGGGGGGGRGGYSGGGGGRDRY
jgi:RNA recognition motif-containing protein